MVAGYGLFLLEGRVDILKGDNPFQRTQAVEKCAQAAAELSFSVMGVAAGYCISGNNRVSEYTKIPSRRCRDGRGSYSDGVFYMDVYSLTSHLADVSQDQALSDPAVNDQQLTPSSSNMITRTSAMVVVVTTLGSLLSFN